MKKILSLLFLMATFCGFSQRGDDELHAVAASACECIRKIDVKLEKKEANAKIESCIITSNTASLIKQTLMPVGKDSIKNVIVANQDYEAIQQFLVEYCPAFKNLLESDNKEYDFSKSKDKKAMENYGKGQDYFTAKEYQKAIKEYEKAVKIDPKFAFAWDNLGRSYKMVNRLEDAIKCYKTSIALDPMGTVPYQNMAVAQELLKDYLGAAKSYEQLISIDPEDPEGYYGASRIYLLQESYENALHKGFKAYLLYKEINSPYVGDAENVLRVIYKELKEKNQIALFNKIAAQYNIKTD